MAKKKNSGLNKNLQKSQNQKQARPNSTSSKSNASTRSSKVVNSTSSSSAFDFAKWSGPLNVFHYLFFLAIYVAINGFNASATIGGPSITDHLFVKNYFTSNVLMPITLLFLLVMLIKTQKLIIHWNLQTKIITALVGYAFLSLIWAQHPGFAVTKLTIWTMGFVGYFWAYDVIRRGGLPVLLQIIFFSGVTVAAIGLWQVYFEVSPKQEAEIRAAGGTFKRFIDMAAGPSSSFGNRNMANHLIVLSFPLSFYLIGCTTLRSAKIVYFIGAAMLLLFSFHSQTRSAYISIGIEIFVILLFVLPKRGRIIGYIGSIGLATTGLLLLDFSLLGWAVFGTLTIFFTALFLTNKTSESPMSWNPLYTIYAVAIGVPTLILANYSYADSTIVPFWDVVLGRVEATATGLASNPIVDDIGNGASNLRIQIWRDSWEIFKSSPLVGYGIGCFYPIFHFGAFDIVNDSAIRYPHNEYFGILTELGLVGMLFFIALVGNALRMSFGAYRMLLNESYLASDKLEKILLLIVITAAAMGTMVNGSFTFPYEYVSPYLVVSCYMAAVGWIHFDTKSKLASVQQSDNEVASSIHQPEDEKVLTGGTAWMVGGIVIGLSVAVFSLNLFWGSRLAIANDNIAKRQWQTIQINQSPWLLHANYHWTFPAVLSTLAARKQCDAVDEVANSLLEEGYSPSFYTALFTKVQCGNNQTVERVAVILSQADLVSTYKRDSAWTNLLRISHANNKMFMVYQHLEKMEHKFQTRPDGVKHRYANSLGRRYQDAALKTPDLQLKGKLFSKGEEYMLIAVEAKDINTKYKADLVGLYLDAQQLDKAEDLLGRIEAQRPESGLTEGLRNRLAVAK